MFRLFVFSCLLAAVAAQTTSVSRCVNFAADLPINTYVEDCITPPCRLPQLQDAVIHIVFKAPYTMRTMRTMATAYMSLGWLEIPIPYDLEDNAVTCNFLTNTYCPVLKDEVVKYTLNMFIESFFPVGTSVTIEFRVQDEQGVPILCIRMPLTIVAPLETQDSRLNSNSTVLITDSH